MNGLGCPYILVYVFLTLGSNKKCTIQGRMAAGQVDPVEQVYVSGCRRICTDTPTSTLGCHRPGWRQLDYR